MSGMRTKGVCMTRYQICTISITGSYYQLTPIYTASESYVDAEKRVENFKKENPNLLYTIIQIF